MPKAREQQQQQGQHTQPQQQRQQQQEQQQHNEGQKQRQLQQVNSNSTHTCQLGLPGVKACCSCPLPRSWAESPLGCTVLAFAKAFSIDSLWLHVKWLPLSYYETKSLFIAFWFICKRFLLPRPASSAAANWPMAPSWCPTLVCSAPAHLMLLSRSLYPFRVVCRASFSPAIFTDFNAFFLWALTRC